jgi:protein-tyrosine kinase
LPQRVRVAERSRLEELRRRIDREPQPRLFALLAEVLRRNGDLDEAARVAREGSEVYPDDPGVRLSLGRVLRDSGDAPSARQEFETVLQKTPEHALAQRLLGQCEDPLAEVDAEGRVPPLTSLADDADLAEEGPSTPFPGVGGKSSGGATPLLTHRGRAVSRKDAGAGEGGEDDSVYVDFSDEGTVTPAKVSPIIESLRRPDSVVGEALRLLGARVQKIREDRKMDCFGVTSALPGDGKSAISLGLASALAREAGQRILLVEADLRRPSITQTLGLPPSAGLSEWLKGELEYVPLRVVEPEGFFLVVAGESGLDRPELLGSPRMDALLRASRSLFDVVLLDTVPIMAVTDTVFIQEHIDGFLIVVRSRQTPREAIQDSLGRLRADKILGIVLNDQDESRDSYKAYAYGRYGMVDTPLKGGGKQ